MFRPQFHGPRRTWDYRRCVFGGAHPIDVDTTGVRSRIKPARINRRSRASQTSTMVGSKAKIEVVGTTTTATRRRSSRWRHIGCSHRGAGRSEEHTSELQSLMRNSYAVFCLKKKKNK